MGVSASCRSALARVRYGRVVTGHRRPLLLGLGLLVGLGAMWLIVTGYLAVRQGRAVRAELAQVRSLVATGRVADARLAAARIPAMTARLQRLSSGPAWWLTAQVPIVGGPARVLRDTSAAANELGSTAVPTLLDDVSTLDPGTLRAHGDTVRIAPLRAARPGLAGAAASLASAARLIDAAPHATWLAGADAQRAQLAADLAQLRGYTAAARRVAAVLPRMLGASTPQRFFIGLQNEAESRGTGGLPGAFAIATVDHGRLRFERYESDAALLGVGTSLDFGADYRAMYGASDPTTSFADSNVSPDFPYTARIWAAMWQRKTGERVDGVVALDPTALSYFLQVTGPVTARGEYRVSAGNVVSLTERDEYAMFGDNDERRAFLVAVLRATAAKLTGGAGSAVGLVQAAGQAATEQRLQVWSRDPRVERVLLRTRYAGALPTGDRPLAAVIVNNAAAGKLDYYLQRSLVYSRTGCGARRDVLATITLGNSAPATGLPAYVTTRLDHPPPGARPGDNHLILDYFATSGAVLQNVTVDGRPATAAAYTQLGYAVFEVSVELPRGSHRTVVLHLAEPAGRGAPVIWTQPGVRPLAVQQTNQTCSS